MRQFPSRLEFTSLEAVLPGTSGRKHESDRSAGVSERDLFTRARIDSLLDRSKRKAARVPCPTVGGGEARPLGCVPVFKYRNAVLLIGTHVIGLAKPAHPFRGKTRCAGPVSRPREGADAHGHTRHGSNRQPLLRWHSQCVRVLLVLRESRQRRARAELNSPPVVPLASCQRPWRSHGPPRPWYFTRLLPRSFRKTSEKL